MCFARTAVWKSSRFRNARRSCFAAMPAVTTGGRHICIWWIGKPTTILPVRIVVKNSGRMEIANGSIAAMNATLSIGLGSERFFVPFAVPFLVSRLKQEMGPELCAHLVGKHRANLGEHLILANINKYQKRT